MHNVVYIQIQSQPVRVYINLFLMHQPATCFVSVIVDNHNLDMHCSQGMDSLILYNHSIDLFAVDSTSCSYKYTASKTVFSNSYRVTCTLVYFPISLTLDTVQGLIQGGWIGWLANRLGCAVSIIFFVSLTLDTVFICTVVRAPNGKIKGTCMHQFQI